MPVYLHRRPPSGVPAAPIPDSWLPLLDAISVNPVSTSVQAAEPMLESLGKPISELLDLVLKTDSKYKNLPQRLKLTNWDAHRGVVQLHPESAQGAKGLTSAGGIAPAPFEATPKQLDSLINAGTLSRDEPPQGMVDVIRRKLAKILGPAPDQP